MQRRVNMTVPGRPIDALLDEIAADCLLLRTRLIARVVSAEYDAALQPFGLGAAQFVLLTVIGQLEPASRAAIGRFHRQDRSTLTRNLRLLVAAGWVEDGEPDGRARPVLLTAAGRTLLHRAEPAWRGAQIRTRALLGNEGVTALAAVARGLIDEN